MFKKNQETSNKKNSKKIIIYLTRHGRTMLNTADRVQGWADSPLTPEGVAVAQKLGRGLKLEEISFDGVYTSDSGRAIETARIILEQLDCADISIKQSKKLREWNFGIFEGDLDKNMMSAIEKQAQIEHDVVQSAMERLPMQKLADCIAAADEKQIAECWNAASSRIQEGLKEVIQMATQNQEETILLVSHGLMINTILEYITGESKVTRIENAAVSKIVYEDGNYTIETLNDTSYIDKESV